MPLRLLRRSATHREGRRGERKSFFLGRRKTALCNYQTTKFTTMLARRTAGLCAHINMELRAAKLAKWKLEQLSLASFSMLSSTDSCYPPLFPLRSFLSCSSSASSSSFAVICSVIRRAGATTYVTATKTTTTKPTNDEHLERT